MNASRGLPDRVRRHDQPRGAGRPADGQGLHRRLRRAVVRLPRAHDDGGDREGRTVVVKEGDWISIDGFTGEVIDGRVDTTPSEVIRVLIEKNLDPKEAPVYQTYAKLMSWADAARKLRVRANADQPDQAAAAMAFGAEGIGLCRTEHMFFGEGKIGPMREMILAENEAERRAALAKLLPLQREDFAGIFRAMDGRPVTIRTLDPPLHEFLPHDEAGVQRAGARHGQVASRRSRRASHELNESNPMLGHRGCRLGITYPEITEMQARAIFEAAVRRRRARASQVEPGDHDPARRHQEGAATCRRRSCARRPRRCSPSGAARSTYLVGTMIEVPRAALTADEIAETAEFFSFGTNDLTQTTFGLSRDDVPRVLAAYHRRRTSITVDPFVSIDRDGVGGADEDRRRRRAAAHEAEAQARHLRRARRRPGVGRVLPRDRPRLRVVLAVPPADRAPGGGAGRPRSDETLIAGQPDGPSRSKTTA